MIEVISSGICYGVAKEDQFPWAKVNCAGVTWVGVHGTAGGLPKGKYPEQNKSSCGVPKRGDDHIWHWQDLQVIWKFSKMLSSNFMVPSGEAPRHGSSNLRNQQFSLTPRVTRWLITAGKSLKLYTEAKVSRDTLTKILLKLLWWRHLFLQTGQVLEGQVRTESKQSPVVWIPWSWKKLFHYLRSVINEKSV